MDKFVEEANLVSKCWTDMVHDEVDSQRGQEEI